VRIENRFDVPAPLAEAWSLLLDIPSTIECFPGAELTERIEEDTYRGRITVKLGPVAMIFRGTVRVEALDEIAHTGTFKADWSETKGRGNAATVTRFAMQESQADTRVELATEVQLAGQVAQYGRGAGVIAHVSSQLVERFAANLRARLSDGAMEQGEIRGLTLASRALLSRLKRKADH
jgi:carbon monoxide dehydrogenase subunit G